MRSLIFNDIMGLVQKNQEIGNITAADAAHLLELTRKLYNHLYARYKEFVEGGFNDMIQDELVLETDIIIAENTRKVREELKLETDLLIAENTKKVREQVKLETDLLIAENTKKLREEYKAEKDAAIAENTRKLREEFKLEIDAAVAENTRKIQEELLAQQQLETIRKLYSKLGSINQVSELLEFPIETIQLALK